MEAKFSLGQTVITRNAIAVLNHDDVVMDVAKHLSGDWGEICNEDKEINERSLKYGGRLMSQYHDRNGVKFWVITEADRSVTTVLLPEDY